MKGRIKMQTIIENNTTPTFYSVVDVQKILGIGRNTAYKLVNSKDFPSLSVGNRIIIPVDRFQTWIDNKSAQIKGDC